MALSLLAVGGLLYKMSREADKHGFQYSDRGTDQFGANIQGRIERDLRPDPSQVPQLATKRMDTGIARLDPYVVSGYGARKLRQRAVLKRQGLSSITQNPWKHRPVRTGGAPAYLTVNDGRHGFHSKEVLKSEFMSRTPAPKPRLQRKRARYFQANPFEHRR